MAKERRPAMVDSFNQIFDDAAARAAAAISNSPCYPSPATLKLTIEVLVRGLGSSSPAAVAGAAAALVKLCNKSASDNSRLIVNAGALPLLVEQWGGFVWVRQLQAGSRVDEQQQEKEEEGQEEEGVAAWLGQRGSRAVLAAGIADELVHVASREYILDCNWKVFCDNYLVRRGKSSRGTVQRSTVQCSAAH